jgi:hypothetical protein
MGIGGFALGSALVSKNVRMLAFAVFMLVLIAPAFEVIQ